MAGCAGSPDGATAETKSEGTLGDASGAGRVADTGSTASGDVSAQPKDAIATSDDAGSTSPETTGADTTSPPTDTTKAGNCPGGAGCDCATNSDCDTGICIELADTKQCASKCVDQCEQGFECKAVSGGADSVNICVPTWAWLCDPCAKSSDCQHLGIESAVCVSHGNDGSFCGAPCNSDDQCPATHTCQQAKSVEGANSKQCVAKASTGQTGPGDCQCSAAARKQNLSTACHVVSKNASGEVVGKCPGVRTCEASGLSVCKGPPPSAEKCNGIDDDCDGKTDEGTCNDENQCTADACDPKQAKDGKEGCVHNALQGPCDADGNDCTQADSCKSGICVPGKVKSCDDGNDCTLDACDAAKGCTQVNDDDKSCDADGNPCTVGDSCTAGKCVKGKPKVCLSGDPCIDAKCDPLKGNCKLKNKPLGATCDDNSVCTTADGCKDGSCIGKVIGCDDGNACTIDSCKADKGCVHDKGQSPCEDGSACTVGDLCTKGACVAGKPKPCEDGNPCTATNCDGATGKCKFSKLTAACNDENACTTNDQCSDAGLCTGKAKSCEDNNPCTDDACNPKTGCTYTQNVAPCDDGNVCTTSSICKSGACVGVTNKVKAVCNDNNPCTTDGCAPNGGGSGPTAGCTHTPNAGKCDDANPCTTGDNCQAGKCNSGINSCECQAHADCSKQEDGNACNGTLICDTSGAKPKCVLNPVTVVKCPTVNDWACGKNLCDPNNGKCAMKAAQDGVDCSDGSICTSGDVCTAGKCLGQGKVVCDDFNACTDDSCHPLKGCRHTANNAPCDDSQPCTVKDTCTAKQCKAGKNVCECQKDIQCTPKEDGNACNGTLVCDKSKAPYKCVVDNTSIVKCPTDKDTGCTQSTCQAATGKCALKDVNAGGSCSDGDACTVGDVCGKDNAGKHSCIGGKSPKCDDGNDCTLDGCDKTKGCVNKGDTSKKLACYTGKPATKGVGACKGGWRSCQADGSASKCTGEVTPNAQETCDGKDDTCDGKTDENCTAGTWRMVVTTMAGQASAGKHDLGLRSGVGVVGQTAGSAKTTVWFGWRAWLKAWRGK